jgi:hypothetical protein
MDVMEQRLQIVQRNKEIIHSQQDGPLLEFPTCLSSRSTPTPMPH